MISRAFAATAVDVSSLTTVNSFKCAKNLGYSHAMIRGYFEAYGNNPGGAIDSNFLKNYENAKQAGYTDIDVYMFPCTGRSTCKTPQQQVNELVNLINKNKIIVRTAWLDVEVDKNSGNWNLGPAKNKEILKEFYAAWKSTGWKFGIYSSQYQWETITGNRDWVLDSSLPLWYSIYDNDPRLNNYRPFGGWTQGTCKQ
ncbi:17662_t:CDS:2, partial [Racocetra fulgida]